MEITIEKDLLGNLDITGSLSCKPDRHAVVSLEMTARDWYRLEKSSEWENLLALLESFGRQ